MTSSTALKVTIRTPSLTSTDKVVDCDSSWTVRRLKEEIQASFDTHPCPADQRLVYAGKLMSDEAVLDVVLRITEDDDERSTYTVHLAVRMPPSPVRAPSGLTATPIRSPETTLRQRTSHQLPTQPQQQSQPQLDPQQQAGMGAESHADVLNMQQHLISNMSNAQTPDQVYWLQHMYAQYMSHYMQYMQSSAAAAPPAVHADFLHYGGNGAIHEQIAQQLAQQNGAAAAAVAAAAVTDAIPAAQAPAPAAANAPNVMMNAGGPGGALGAMEDEDEIGGQRDVLDWFYIASRVLVLFSIVYFYSSVTRFLLVTGLGLFVYLWNVGYFRGGRGADVEQQEEIRREVDQMRNAANVADREHADDEVVDSAGEGESSAQQQAQPPTAHNSWATAFTFVSGFFTSLLPEQPQVI